MLRVGLTGGLGSGKTTVAAMLRELGAHVIEADELGRALMEPASLSTPPSSEFGPQVVNPDGRLEPRPPRRAGLSRRPLGRLNAIVHPPAIEAQQQVDGRGLRARSRGRCRRRVGADL